MAFFDFLNRKQANNSVPSGAQLPVATSTYGFNRIAAYGSGQIVSLLTRRLPGSHRDWKSEAGDLGLNSIVAIAIDWYNRNFSQAIPKVYSVVNQEQVEAVYHPVLELIKNPSESVVSSVFWSFIIQDLKLQGNAFARKIRVSGKVVSLQYLPNDMVMPIGDDKEPIKYWSYNVDGKSYRIDTKDMLHFRYGRDPGDIRLGRSAVSSVLREISTDNYASTTAYSIMKNNALPSIIIGPDNNEISVDISPDDARTMKRRLQEDFSGDNGGGVAVLTGPYQFNRVSWSPEELALDVIRRLPEERIAAALGLNAMVLGLGAGLERSTYQNYERAQQAAWEDGMIPLLKQLSEVITSSLLYEYPETTANEFFEFDISNVRALSDDLDAAAVRAEKLYSAGIATLEEAKRIAGLSVSNTNNTSDLQSETVVDETKAIGKHKPTEEMASIAENALEWRKEFGRGGTEVGIARAVQLKNREMLSDDTVKRMYSFFSRHEVDKQAEGFSNGEEGFPSNGRIAWDLWGGDPGFAWSKRIVDRMKEDE